jgi:gliding motility-associated-like protein
MTTLLLIRLIFKKTISFKITRFYKYLFIVLIAMLIPFIATPQVTADFSTNTSQTGCGSLVVEFKDLSLGNPTSWLWDFGNGNTSNLQYPTAIYSAPGVYNVFLTVSDGVVSNSKLMDSYIEVYKEPNVALQVPTNNGCNPFNTFFEDLSVADTSIVSWQWDFGDGGSSDLQNPEYTYLSSGLYSVSLSVEDVNGCQDLYTEVELIEVSLSPVADFTSSVSFSCDSSQVVSFLNNSLSASLFAWDFGDGSISNLEEPSHNFNTGIFSVSLYASEGICADTLVLTDIIEVVGYLSPDFAVDTSSGCEGLNVNFVDLTANTPNTFLWNFGDGIISTLQNPSHVFDSAGIYDITFTTSFSGQCSRSITFPSKIQVFASPVVSFITDTILGCSVPYDVLFTDNTIGATHWHWDFGDGNLSSLENPSNTYVSSGVYDVSLVVENNYGCLSSTTIPNRLIINELPLIDINASPLISCAGEDIIFTDLSSLGVTDWYWYFGDDSISNDQNPVHKYGFPGIYDVRLVAGVNYCKDTLVISNYIEIIEPAALFEETYNCDFPLKVEFENLSAGADNVFWDFGDGNTSTLFNPAHNFLTLGTHIISLWVSNSLTGCEHVFVKEIELTNPIAQFDYVTRPSGDEVSDGCIPQRMYIDNQSQDWAQIITLWGDGGTQHGPSHIYTSVGVFDVTVIVTDIHDCRDTMIIEDMITMHDVVADFSITNMLGCDSLFVEFEDLSEPASSVTWDFGDGGSSIINNPKYIYFDEGFYDVTLYAKSFYGCRDTITKPKYISLQYPKAEYTSNVNEICEGDEVQFSSLSVGVGISLEWYFGDGTSSSLPEPIHEFTSNGMYDVNLLVTDSFGCSDNLLLSNYIEVLSPVSSFYTLGLNSGCPPLISDFVNLSSSDANYFEWNFGDGFSSLVENPSHLFSNSGLFDVSLIVMNEFGCRDTMRQNSFINILETIPAGSFLLSDTLICSNDIVSFTPLVLNADSFLWDFGNGVISTDSLTSFEYTNTGMFIPTLIVKNSSGCQLTVRSDDTIIVNEVVVDAGLNLAICKGESIELNAIGSGSVVNWSPSVTLSSLSVNNPQASPIFSELFYVSHTDGLCTAIDSVYVTVHNDIPNANFTASNFCKGDLTYFEAFSGLPNSNSSYLWSFGQNGNLANIVLGIGDNNVSLVVENLDNSCKDTVEQNIEIFANPVADFLVREVCLGELVDFADNSSNNSNVWYYNFGDGVGFSENQSPTYIYSDPGIYNANLTVTSAIGCKDSIVKKVIVHNLPIVDFAIENYCEGEGNIFTNLSSVVNSNIYSTEYSFNDGFISNDSITTHIFNGSGFFDVILTVKTTDGCSSSKVAVTEVFAKPIVNFSVSQLCEGDKSIFDNFSFVTNANIISQIWNFGSEGLSYNENAEHTFSTFGDFDVSLSVESDKGCKSLLSKNISINKLPSTGFEFKADVCLGKEVRFSYFTDNDGDIAIWNYNFGDGNFSNQQSPSHTYTQTGSFDLALEVVSAQGCKNDTIMHSIIEVHPFPVADFQTNKLVASELFSEIIFYNQSLGEAYFEWDFDNGEYSFEKNPIFMFANSGVYNVLLTATNEAGCSSVMTKDIHINPEYTFFVPDAFSPNGDGVNDVFEPKGNRISSFEMQVFDRWGGVIFESSDIDSGWDGNNFYGQKLEEDIYIYKIAIYDLNERLWTYNGEFSLMR